MRQREGNESIYGGIVATPSRRQFLPRLHTLPSPSLALRAVCLRRIPPTAPYLATVITDLYETPCVNPQPRRDAADHRVSEDRRGRCLATSARSPVPTPGPVREWHAGDRSRAR